MNKHDIISWGFLIFAFVLLLTGNAEISFFAMLFSKLQQIHSELYNMKNRVCNYDGGY